MGRCATSPVSRSSGATEAAREGSRLLLGPWTHTTPPLAGVGRGRFRRHGRAEPDAAQPRRRRGDAALLRPLAEGDRRRATTTSRRCASSSWARTSGARENEWPLARAVETEFFLSSGGNANSIAGDGALVERSAGRRPAGCLPLRPVPPRADRRRAALLLPGHPATPAPSTSARSKRGRTSSSTRPRRWRRTPR